MIASVSRASAGSRRSASAVRNRPPKSRSTIGDSDAPSSSTELVERARPTGRPHRAAGPGAPARPGPRRRPFRRRRRRAPADRQRHHRHGPVDAAVQDAAVGQAAGSRSAGPGGRRARAGAAASSRRRRPGGRGRRSRLGSTPASSARPVRRRWPAGRPPPGRRRAARRARRPGCPAGTRRARRRDTSSGGHGGDARGKREGAGEVVAQRVVADRRGLALHRLEPEQVAAGRAPRRARQFGRRAAAVAGRPAQFAEKARAFAHRRPRAGRPRSRGRPAPHLRAGRSRIITA